MGDILNGLLGIRNIKILSAVLLPSPYFTVRWKVLSHSINAFTLIYDCAGS